MIIQPTTLRYDAELNDLLLDNLHAEVVMRMFAGDPIVIHEDECIAGEERVIAAVYLGIPWIDVEYLDAVPAD